MATRPTAAPAVSSRLSTAVAHEGDTLTWRVDVTTVPGLRDVVGHLPGDRWTTTTPEHGHVAAAPAGGATVPMAVLARIDRWGVRRLGPAQVGGFGDLRRLRLGLVRAAGRDAWRRSRRRGPSRRGRPSPTPWGWSGSTAALGSAAAPSSAEIRPFRTGDRLRRIHWPVSLRTGALHVTTTYADQDAEVRLVLDAIRDLGERDPDTGRRSSLDVAVEAAGAVAAHYLGTGDRVGLSVLGGGGVVEVPAVGGHHQLARVLLGLGRAEPSRGTVGDERALRAQLRRSIPPGAFVVLLSALVSAEPLAHAVRLARSGHAVVVVDTLPVELQGPEATDDALCAATGVDDPRLARLVWRLRLLDREREARRCAMAGVPVIAWRGPGSLDTVLRQAARRSRAPRVASR